MEQMLEIFIVLLYNKTKGKASPKNRKRGEYLGQPKKYECGPYLVAYCGTGYIVQNTLKPFEEGHTHLRNFKSCIDAINFVQHKKLPTRTGLYYLISLKRLSDDAGYIKRIDDLLAVRKQKGKGLPFKRPAKHYNKR